MFYIISDLLILIEGLVFKQELAFIIHLTKQLE